MIRRTGAGVLCVIAVSLCAGTAPAETVNVRFYSGPDLTVVQREIAPGQPALEAAIVHLLAGPTPDEQALGLYSAIPAGTAPVSISFDRDVITIDLSADVLVGLDEFQLQQIFNQFRTTLSDFPAIFSIRLTCQGALLATYLPPAPTIDPAPPADFGFTANGSPMADGPHMANGAALSGRNITFGPSHGRFWNGSGWYWQRSDPCGFGEAVLEDTNSIRLGQFLYQYLTQDGATVHVPRELNESNCCHPATGLPWWKMAARYWLQANGIPSYVWNSSTSDSNDDIRARPLYADYRGSDIYIACHTNAGGGGTANGTETYRDTAMEHPAHETASYNLAVAVQNSVVSAIREMYDGGWADRRVKDSAGGFGEIRIPNRPAILIELGFHDNCTRDGLYLTDNFFRSVAEWGLYRGVCQYFGATPTWDKYSDEFVSDTIPTVMNAGQTYNVSVTFRNRGVVWSNVRNFRLGAVNDSDPFTTFNRVNISGEVRPGQTYTFNFQMTAPAAGDYVSDWRMVRDGVTWFGPTLTKNIQVNPNVVDTQPPSIPTNLTAIATGPNSVQLNWTASFDNIGVAGYDIRRDGTIIGSSDTNSYTDNTALPLTTYTYQVRARDFTPNYSGFSSPAVVTTPPGPVVVFSDGFNGNLNNWTQVAGKEYVYSTARNHGVFPGGGTAFMAAGQSDQMYHSFARPFAQAKVSGWFYDQQGGWKAMVCGAAYRQSLSLRDDITGVGFIVDNCMASNVASGDYFWRTVGAGGITYTSYGSRNPNTACGGDWIYFETTVTPGAPGSAPTGTILLKVTDGAGTSSTVQNLTNDFFSFGIGRITLGLGVSSAGEGYWDDIAFEATPPDAPSMGVPTAGTNQIVWTFSPADDNLFGFDVADAGGTVVSPAYGDTGWLTRTATAWTETGLASNTSYTRKVRAWNGTLDGPFSPAQTVWTLSVPPAAGTITPSTATLCAGGEVTWTAVDGFGPGKVQYYRYAWDQTPTHNFTGSEPQWSNGTLSFQPAPGAWYLHVQGYNGDDVPNGSFSYSIDVVPGVPVDFDADCDVDQDDVDHFQSCATGPTAGPPASGCEDADLDEDGDVDQSDFGLLQRCISGPDATADPDCWMP